MNNESRYFQAVGHWASLLWQMLSGQLWNLFFNKNSISPRLSEIISLSVSRVNDCSNCSYLHSRTALESGLNENEINLLLNGDYGQLSQNELPAVLYAQHWAEQNGKVSRKARNTALEFYGENALKSIEISIKSVIFGNLCSNTVEEKRSGNSKISLLPYILSLPIAGVISFAGKIKDKNNE